MTTQRINDGGPAYPVPGWQHDEAFNGMSLRDATAIAALPTAWAIVNAADKSADLSDVAGWAYRMADAMLIARAQSAQPAAPVADDDGWILWGGGECPVDGGARIEVRFRNGQECATRIAGGWNWKHWDDGSDGGYHITAYRLAREPS